MVQQKSFVFEADRSRMLVGLHLSSSAKLLLVVLDAITGSDDFCCPSLSSLADLMGCSEHIARQAIRETESAGYLEVEKYSTKTTSYRIEWSAINPDVREKFNVNRYL